MKRRSLFKLLGAVALAPTGLFKETRQDWVAQWVTDPAHNAHRYTAAYAWSTPQARADAMSRYVEHLARRVAETLDGEIMRVLDKGGEGDG